MNILSKLNNIFRTIGQKLHILETQIGGVKYPIHYQSNTEIETGDYWIDGKPIYEQVFDISLSSIAATTWTVIKSDIPGDTVISYDFYVLQSTNYLANYSCRALLRFNNDTLQIYLSAKTTTSTKIRIRYTKLD